MKKFIALVLALSCIFCVVGCGQQLEQSQGQTDETENSIHELHDGTLEFAVAPNVDTIQMTVDTFKTNTTQIMVTTDDELGEDEVSVLLFSIKNGDEVFIGKSTLSEDENHNKIVFANLSSTSNYKIGVSARNLTQHITIKISEAKPAE